MGAERIEAAGLDLERDLRAAGRDDAAVDEDVDDVGDEMFEEPLVVRDREDAEVRAARCGPR